MAQSISENHSRDLGKEVHKVRDKSKVNSHCMDDVTGNENIAELFADKYKVLYCVPTASSLHLDIRGRVHIGIRIRYRSV